MTKFQIGAYTAACAVTGAVIMTLAQPPRTAAQAVTPVRVMNGPARPVLSTLAPEEYFRTLAAVQLNPGDNVKDVFFDPVPAGKRLVIESVEVTVKASPGKPLTMVAFRGGIFAHPIAIEKLWSTVAGDYYVGTHSVRWYAEPGEDLSFSASAPGENNAGSATVNAFITGYYVAAP
jgi:hypothetical protein